jgi:hypothetical protein
MDRFFIEDKTDDLYKIAVIDRERIFSAQNPGLLGTVFECSSFNPRREDDAQIFYAMAPSIDGLNLFIDMIDSYRSRKLNTWSIVTKNSDINNLFLAMEPLNRDHRCKLYATQHSITPTETVTATSNSLFSLVALAETQIWKTGILQRCIDCLVFLENRGRGEVYAVIDEEYRRLLRFKYETEYKGPLDTEDEIIIELVRKIIRCLGLKNSHDSTFFSEIPDEIDRYLIILSTRFPILSQTGSIKDRLTSLLSLWSGANIKECEGGYTLEVESNVLEALNYMQPLLEHPDILEILETPM